MPKRDPANQVLIDLHKLAAKRGVKVSKLPEYLEYRKKRLDKYVASDAKAESDKRGQKRAKEAGQAAQAILKAPPKLNRQAPPPPSSEPETAPPSASKLTLDTKLVEGFSVAVLQSRFDNPKPTPQFHRELWELCCSNDQFVALAAPRGHGKSTAVTHTYGLAALLFKVRDFALVVSDTEGQAVQFLQDIKIELTENEDLIAMFQVERLVKDSEADVIVQLKDGHQFRLIAKGSEQKVRGIKWRNKRPNLILCDDLENDEIIMNPDRREKFRNWFFNALVPCGGDNMLIRLVGTVLHLDAVLERLLKAPSWRSMRFQAHNEDYSSILWPEKFSEQRLRAIKQMYIDQGNPDGYSQEFLNNPLDAKTAFYQREDFVPQELADRDTSKIYYAAIDFAITKDQRANYTAIGVGGLDCNGVLHIDKVIRGRWDSLEIIEQIFAVHNEFQPEIFVAEAGAIEKAIGPFLRQEMMKRGIFPNMKTITPTRDKQSRARSFQGRMRAKAVRFPKAASWYPDFEEEMLRFPRAANDDMVDTMSMLGLILDQMQRANTPQEDADDEYELMAAESYTGRNAVCGY